MATTRLSVEFLLTKRCGKRLTFVGLDGATRDGTNADLADPIAAGLRSLGLPVADITNPTSAELSAVADAQVDQLLDVAELRCLKSILGNIDEVDEQAGTDRKDFGKFAVALQAVIEALETRCRDMYGVGIAAPTVGVIGLNFAESGDPADWPVLS
ncbi:MAG: hypothetical protein JWN86_3616 [Planctomycetota bacterium]|nr:hypothetical protein [Planctomycetota bacterium]